MFPRLGIINRHTELMIRKRRNEIEKYLENILNSPSTINKVLPYYGIGYSQDLSEMYLLFKDKIVRTYGISEEDYYNELRLEMWCQCLPGPFCEPIIVAPNIPK